MRLPRLPLLAAAALLAGGASGYGLSLVFPGGAAAGVKAEADEPSPHFLSVGQFTIPVPKNGVTQSFLLAQIRLEMDYAHVPDYSKQMPKLRSAILTYLFALARRGDIDAATLDPQTLGEDLTAMLARDFGGDAVEGVLFDRLLLQDVRRAHGEGPDDLLAPAVEDVEDDA